KTRFGVPHLDHAATNRQVEFAPCVIEGSRFDRLTQSFRRSERLVRADVALQDEQRLAGDADEAFKAPVLRQRFIDQAYDSQDRPVARPSAETLVDPAKWVDGAQERSA